MHNIAQTNISMLLLEQQDQREQEKEEGLLAFRRDPSHQPNHSAQQGSSLDCKRHLHTLL